MRTEEMILEEYRKGGLHERLNLYLQYRDLRTRFTQIDSDERASLQAAVSKKKEKRTLLVTGSTGHRIVKCCSPHGQNGDPP
jgi:hypothetical protein